MVKNVQIKSDQWITVRAETGRGSMVCLLPPYLAAKAGLEHPPRKYRISLEGGGVLKLPGDMGMLVIDGKESSTVILVSDRTEKALLGMDALECLGAKTNMAGGQLQAHTRARAGKAPKT